MDIEECSDVMADKMLARLNYVPLDCLVAFVGKRTPIDLIGIVTTVGPVGSVKRRKDGSEAARRDLTFADQTCVAAIMINQDPLAHSS